MATPPAGKTTGGAFLEQAQRFVAYGEIVLQRLARFAKIDRKRVGLHLADLQQIGVDHDAERPSELLGERQDGNAVADAEGMVGDDDQRPVGKIARRPGAVDTQRHVDQRQHAAEDALAGRHDLAAPEIVEPGVAVAAGEPLDGAG